MAPSFTVTPVISTTRAGVEAAIVIAFVGWRIVVLVHLLPALFGGPATASVSTGIVLVAGAVVLESVAACAASIRARQTIGAVWTWCEIVGSCALVTFGPHPPPLDHRAAAWAGFVPSLLLAVLGLAGAALTRSAPFGRMQLAAATALSTTCYLVAALRSAPGGFVPTIAGNALVYPTVAVLIGVVTVYLRRTAAGADRRATGGAERSAEPQQTEWAPYENPDTAELLALEITVPVAARTLIIPTDRKPTQFGAAPASPGRLPAALSPLSGATDTSVTSVTRPGADTSVTRPATPPLVRGPGQSVTVATTVRRVVDRFPDLPIETVLDLGGRIPLAPGPARAVSLALRAILHNIRAQGAGRSIVIHADGILEAGLWELTVRRSGGGHAAATAQLTAGARYTLAESALALGALAEYDITADIQVEPEEEAVVVLRGGSAAIRG